MCSIDWGLLANWASAVGSVGAVVAALILANMERKRANRAEVLATKEKVMRRAALITETARQLETAKRISDNFVARSKVSLTMRMSTAAGVRTALQSVRTDLGSIRNLSHLDLDIFVEIGKIMALCDGDEIDPLGSQTSITMYLSSLTRRLDECLAALSDLDSGCASGVASLGTHASA